MSDEEIKEFFARKVAEYRAAGKSEAFITGYARAFWNTSDRLRGQAK